MNTLAVATSLVLATLSASAVAGQVNIASLNGAAQHDRFIVKYRDGSSARANVATASSSLLRAAGTTGTRDGLTHLRRLAVGADVVKTQRKLDRAEAEALMRQLAADPNVEYVEVDRMLHAVMTPNDTSYAQQWGYNATQGINAGAAWDKATGSGAVVAVIDTGITTHSDLAANILPGYDFISDTAVSVDGNGRDNNPADPGDWWANSACGTNAPPSSNSSWHGTHVAGTVAAVTNNAKGVAGTAFNAKVVPVRVLGKCGGYDSDISDGIIWASGGSVPGVPANPNPAVVINMSLGGFGACSATQQSAINGAVSRGTTVVVAAGNDANDASENNPANCGNVVVVGAVDSAGKRSIWSATQESSYGSVVDVAAPGTNILSTLNSGTKTPSTESYASYGGTSMATPHVAGVVALMQSLSPRTPAQVEAILKSTARAFPATPSKPIGTGIVNARAALDALITTGQTYTNTTDYAINDNATVDSPITVSGRSGNAPSNASVSVNILHTYQGDLKVDLVAPDGSLYNIHNRTGSSTDNVIKTVTLNLSSELLNGTWKLRVNDNAGGDTGKIDSWSVKF